ncbi:piggyBac transposable element-derived protein 4 [Trichonephila clavipes]|nr:piggyBac transposable element-derived protein 4 [Trichonephila clavipes]
MLKRPHVDVVRKGSNKLDLNRFLGFDSAKGASRSSAAWVRNELKLALPRAAYLKDDSITLTHLLARLFVEYFGKYNEIELDVSANFDEEADGLFAWKEVEGSEMINVLPFSSKVGLKVDAISFKTENDFFKLMLTDEILAVLVEETIRYAFDLLNLHGESSDKRKHASSLKPTDKMRF